MPVWSATLRKQDPAHGRPSMLNRALSTIDQCVDHVFDILSSVLSR